MKIGIDIDGVLTDEKKFIIDYGSRFFSQNNIPYDINDNKFDGREIFNVSQEDYKLFLNNYIFDYSLNCTIVPYANEIIKKLKKKHEIFIITSRDFTTYENKYKTKMQKIVKDWLCNNDILYDEIIFTNNKVSICNEKKIDIMIEDRPENILLISKNIPVLCYNHPYNKKISNKNIYRCYSWYDIYKKINMLIEKNNLK